MNGEIIIMDLQRLKLVTDEKGEAVIFPDLLAAQQYMLEQADFVEHKFIPLKPE